MGSIFTGRRRGGIRSDADSLRIPRPACFRKISQPDGELTDADAARRPDNRVMPRLVTRFSRFVRRFVGEASWRPPDETLMSPAERAFVQESVSGHDADAILGATFGSGDPDRLLGFPDDGHRH